MSDQAPAPSVPPGGPGAPGAEEALIALSTEIARYSTLSDLMDHLPAHLAPLFPDAAVGVVLHDAVPDEMYLALSFGSALANVPRRVPVGTGPASWVWQSQQARTDLLTAADSHPTLRALYECGFRSVHWVPMTAGRKRLGTFAVARYTADPDGDFERVLGWVASAVALAIEHTTQVESLEQLGRQLAEERDRAHSAMFQLGERVKELTALHRTARLLEDEQLSVAGLLEQIAALLPPAFQFPEIAQASVSYGNTIAANARLRRHAVDDVGRLPDPRRRARRPDGRVRGSAAGISRGSVPPGRTQPHELARRNGVVRARQAGGRRRGARRRGPPAERARPRAPAARDHDRRGIRARPAPPARGDFAAAPREDSAPLRQHRAVGRGGTAAAPARPRVRRRAQPDPGRPAGHDRLAG